ncbi:hypothetical protein A9P82_12425 [Arachidicoccus ginsenosidimutans]|uniref:hypothetical protein n=1 Tax=Arachidicoccus sp. BS20 TaxID=1850526 RepID=UPI0007F0E821|nr:hypothetical protein [Arachidicoccus sp. BS20]ANI90016.1 hypothetical protein A9P82_12425 [Arachidicoccus sp. BS20]
MNKKLTKIGILSVAFLLAVVFRSNAQSATRSSIILGVGPQASLPLSNFKDNYNWSLGGSVQADFAIVKKDLYVVVNGGFDNYFAKGDAKDLQIIPAQAGLKYYFPTTNLYIQGTAGAGFIVDKKDVGADKSASFIYTPQIGYLLPIAKNSYLDFGVNFRGQTKFVDGGKSNNAIGLRVAYNFGL